MAQRNIISRLQAIEAAIQYGARERRTLVAEQHLDDPALYTLDAEGAENRAYHGEAAIRQMSQDPAFDTLLIFLEYDRARKVAA